MNKDDIFVFDVRDDIVEASLAWDTAKNVRVSASDEEFVSFAKKEAVGWLWESYANEIIEHIQLNTLKAPCRISHVRLKPQAYLPEES